MKYLPLTIGLVLILIPVYLYFKKEKSDITSVTLGGEEIKVEVADTMQKRQKGLMGRESLADNEGMLFIFPTNSIHPFWMKNTLIDLDIIWISDDLKIVEIWENAPASTPGGPKDPKRYQPKEKSKYVLEVNAGFVSKNGVKVGDGLLLSR